VTKVIIIPPDDDLQLGGINLTLPGCETNGSSKNNKFSE
jgi:hypothetical protein